MFTSEEMVVMLVCLIGRRNELVKLNDNPYVSEATKEAFRQDMVVMDAIQEKMFPGSVKSQA